MPASAATSALKRYPIRFHIEPRLVSHVAFSVSTIILETDNHFSHGVIL